MIKLPDFKKKFDYENNFYLSCDSSRIGKLLAHYELYKMAKDLPGAIVECGVFKGAAFVRFAMYRELFSGIDAKKLIGFDSFGIFPETKYPEDIEHRKVVMKTSGPESISKSQLAQILKRKGLDKKVDLVKGDVRTTIPKYLKAHPELRIALLNLDVDMYEPSKAVLEHLYPRIVKGGILMLDDYGVITGESDAVDEYFKGKRIEIKQFPFSTNPSYIIK